MRRHRATSRRPYRLRSPRVPINYTATICKHMTNHRRRGDVRAQRPDPMTLPRVSEVPSYRYSTGVTDEVAKIPFPLNNARPTQPPTHTTAHQRTGPPLRQPPTNHHRTTTDHGYNTAHSSHKSADADATRAERRQRTRIG